MYKKCQTVQSRIVIQSEMSVMSHDCTCVHTPLYLSPAAMPLWLCSISVHYRPARAKGGFRSPHSQPAGGDPIFLSSSPEENVLIKLSHFSVTRDKSVRFPWCFLDMRSYIEWWLKERNLYRKCRPVPEMRIELWSVTGGYVLSFWRPFVGIFTKPSVFPSIHFTKR